MSNWPLAFLIIALLAALLGFTEIIGSAAWIARVLFALFLALFLVSITQSRKSASNDERSMKGPD
jgi:uncharacterized membrane protein YtjA (UPF0391 family)